MCLHFAAWSMRHIHLAVPSTTATTLAITSYKKLTFSLLRTRARLPNAISSKRKAHHRHVAPCINPLSTAIMSSSKLLMPEVGSHLILTTPAPHVLKMTLNRPKQLNAMTDAMEEDICRVFEWFETEPSLWVIILAGKGRAFCAGQDLKDWLSKNQTSETVRHASGEPMQSDAEVNKSIQRLKRGGFGGMSTRRSAKPIIAAVDGICMGGGTETILNCDMVVASSRSVIGLPEVARGVVAAMGGIPRLTQLCGHQRASELLLLGKPISAKEAHDRYNMVNRLVEVAKSTSEELGQAAVDQAAVEIAIQLTQNSPDSVLVTKSALVMARDATDGDIDASARENMLSDRSRLLYVGKNINEGLEAFKGKRDPKWFNPVQLASSVSDARSKL